jgi:hypothetical protein
MNKYYQFSICLFICFALLSLELSCSNALPCSRVHHDRQISDGLFGCYQKVAATGGFVGGTHEASDDNGCIVLTQDSLYKQFVGDSVMLSIKFGVTWQKDRDNRSVARLTFDNGNDPERLACSWQNDSLWVGCAGPIMDAISFLYVKCCR